METKQNRSSVIFGTLLLAVGILTLLGQVIGPLGGGILWPGIIVGLGLAFFVGMVLGGRAFGALAIPGSIITGIGLMLYLQNLFGLWETWSYAWGLIICFVGVGLFIYGAWSGIPDLRRSGLSVANVGLTLFIIFGILFEGVFGISGVSTPGNLFWPVLLVIVGLGMLLARSYRLVRPSEETRHADRNLFWPVIFIGAGILWMFVLQGRVSMPQVNSLVSLWPVLLIAGGINIILGRRWEWMNLLVGILVVVGMFYFVFNSEALGMTSRTPWGMLGVNFSSQSPVTEWIAGSGKVIEEKREIGKVDEVVLQGAGSLEIIQGSPSSLTIEAEDNLIPYILTTQSGGRLSIETKPGIGFTNTRPIHYRLTVQDMRSISISGASEITSEKLETDSLEINLSGMGDVQIKDLQTRELDLAISGSGSFTAAGAADDLKIDISGAGSFNSPDLKSRDARVTISGVGKAVVWVTDHLSPRISGVGSVAYYGSPTLNQDNSGLISVRKLGDK